MVVEVGVSQVYIEGDSVSVTFLDGTVWTDSVRGLIQTAAAAINPDVLRCLLIVRHAADLKGMEEKKVFYKPDVAHEVVVIQ